MANLSPFPWTDQFVEIQIVSNAIAHNNTTGLVSMGLAGRVNGSYPNIYGYYAKLAGTGLGTDFAGSGTVSSSTYETGVYSPNGLGAIGRSIQDSGTLSGGYNGHYRFEISGFRPVRLRLVRVNADGSYTTISNVTHDWGAGLLSIASGNPGIDGGNAADGNGGSIAASTVSWNLLAVGTL